jgi:hypothetical protein
MKLFKISKSSKPGSQTLNLVSLMTGVLERIKAPVVTSQGESDPNLQASSPISR